jgi:hypothetical protein
MIVVASRFPPLARQAAVESYLLGPAERVMTEIYLLGLARGCELFPRSNQVNDDRGLPSASDGTRCGLKSSPKSLGASVRCE